MAVTDEDPRENGIAAFLRLRVELWLVVVFMALAFGAGILVTSLYEETDPAPVVGVQDPGMGFPIAPPLSDEQIQQGLPPGHPDLGIGGTTGPADGAAGEGSPPADGSPGPEKGKDDGSSGDQGGDGT
jgi:hypothetical protein